MTQLFNRQTTVQKDEKENKLSGIGVDNAEKRAHTSVQEQPRTKLDSWKAFSTLAGGAQNSSELQGTMDAEKLTAESKVNVLAMQLGMLQDFNQGESAKDTLSQKVVYCHKTGQASGLAFCNADNEGLASVAPQWIETGDKQLQVLATQEPVAYLVYTLGKLARDVESVQDVKMHSRAKAAMYAAIVFAEGAKYTSGFVSVMQLAVGVACRRHSQRAKMMLEQLFYPADAGKLLQLETGKAKTRDLLNMWASQVFFDLTNNFGNQVYMVSEDNLNSLHDKCMAAFQANEQRIANALKGLDVSAYAVSGAGNLRTTDFAMMNRSVKETSAAKAMRLKEAEGLQNLADEFADLMNV